MRRINTLNKATDLFGPGKHGWKNGVPGTADRPTEGQAEWFNSMQEEVAGVVEAAGLALSPGDSGQLAEALGILFASSNWSQSGVGAAIRALLNKVRETSVSITDYTGADPTGATNSDAALASALTHLTTVGGGVLDIPAGTFNFGASFAIPANVIVRGRGPMVSILRRNFVGVLITQVGTRSGLENLGLDGNAGANPLVTFTGGAGFIFQHMRFVRVVGTSSNAITFAADTGNEFRAYGCAFVTTGALGAVAAVAVVGTDTAACPRHFTNCAGEGSTLYDFSGANDTFVTGGYSNGFITSATTSKLMVMNMRIGAAAGTVTIRGVNHTWKNCVFAVVPTLTCTDSEFDCITPDWDVTDNGTGNSVFQRLRQYAAQWTASGGTQPAIGDGSIAAYFSRQGAQITVQFDIRFGPGTTFGTGNWRLSVPRGDLNPYTVVQVVGSAFTQTSGAKEFVVIPRITAGNGYVEFFFVDTAGLLQQLGSATQAWGATGRLRGSFTYLTS